MKVAIALILISFFSVSLAQVSPLFVLATRSNDPMKNVTGLPVDLLRIDAIDSSTTVVFQTVIPAEEAAYQLSFIGSAYDQEKNIYYFIINAIKDDLIKSSIFGIDCVNFVFTHNNVPLTSPVIWDISINQEGQIIYLSRAVANANIVNWNVFSPITGLSEMVLENVALIGSTSYIASSETLLISASTVGFPVSPVITIGLDYTVTQFPTDRSVADGQCCVACFNLTDQCYITQQRKNATYHSQYQFAKYSPFTKTFEPACTINEKSIDLSFSYDQNACVSADATNRVLAYVANSFRGNRQLARVAVILFIDVDTCEQKYVLQRGGSYILYEGPEFAYNLPL